MSHDATHGRVIVIGGGLAGIAAAVRLSDHDMPVTLVETRKRLGGRATSFSDPATDQTLDNCQHVLLRCCTNLIDLYRRLGVEDRIHWHRTIYFADGRGRIDTLRPDDLPAPLHLLQSLLSFGAFSPAQKLAVMRGMLAVLQVSRAARQRLNRETFQHWLEQHNQPAEVIDRFWSLIVTSACNEAPDRLAAGYALQVLQEGMLYENSACDMGVPGTALVDLYNSVQPRIERAGGEVILGNAADQLLYDPHQHRITYLRLADRQEITGDAFISALPPDRLVRIVPPNMNAEDPRLQGIDKLPTSPIVGIHLFFHRADDRAVMELPHIGLMDSPLHWVFNKGLSEDPPAQHLHGVISAAHELIDLSAEELVALARAEIGRVLPASVDADLLHSRVIKEKRATFAAHPHVDALRPACALDGSGESGKPEKAGAGNLFLAGDWVYTGWPATMEGAVRSGYRAAAAVLRCCGPGRSALPPLPAADLAPGFLYRVLSG